MMLPITSAPGKLVLAGEYAVLDAQPAVVVAVDRRVRFGPRIGGAPASEIPEVVAALLDADLTSPEELDVDASALRHGAQKLGLGSSAAAAVAATGALYAARGESLAVHEVLERVLLDAAEAHARVQPGGSGIDVAASALGGLLRFQRVDAAFVTARRLWPAGLHLAAAFTGNPVQTSDMVARMRDFAARDERAYRRQMAAVASAAVRLDDALERGDVHDCLEQLWRAGSAVESLGAAADVPIVPRAVRLLRDAVHYDGVAVKTSGAGGGDCVVALSADRAAFAAFERECARLGFVPIALGVDREGVRLEPARENGYPDA